ncbi:hypothetical protein AX16_005604 [Volvariella volvacea WC 439]|nr:hypothetical protein AX16_005604 [Volvariella volvacea WC 439]
MRLTTARTLTGTVRWNTVQSATRYICVPSKHAASSLLLTAPSPPLTLVTPIFPSALSSLHTMDPSPIRSPAQPRQQHKQQPPLYSWRDHSPPHTRLVYIRNIHDANTELQKLKIGPVGFDLEWKPTFVSGQPENRVALVQIATEDTILLLHLTSMQVIPEGLRDFLLRADIVKAGVGIQRDALKFFRDWGVSMCNCVDLSLLARSVDNARWKGRYVDPIGLSRLLEHYKGYGLAKGRITRSNWEAYLKPHQQEYAANDAYAGLQLYQHLLGLGSKMSKQPLPSCYTFNATHGKLCLPTGLPWHPQNPDYEPGPLPVPKKLKKQKAEGASPAPTPPAAVIPANYSVAHTQSPTRPFGSGAPSPARSLPENISYRQSHPASPSLDRRGYPHKNNFTNRRHYGPPKQDNRPV